MLKLLEKSLTDKGKKQQYELLKFELDEIYDKVAESFRVLSRCHHFKEGQKPSRIFLNLEKVRCSQGKVRRLTARKHNITDPYKIEHNFFYKSFFKNSMKQTLSGQTNCSNP